MIKFKTEKDYYDFLSMFDSLREALEYISALHDGEFEVSVKHNSILLFGAYGINRIPDNLKPTVLNGSAVVGIMNLPGELFGIRVDGDLLLPRITNIDYRYRFPYVKGKVLYKIGA